MNARMCRHDRQLTVCAVCAPEAEARLKRNDDTVAAMFALHDGLVSLELDALRVLSAFCHEKVVGYGGWTEAHAVALGVLDEIIRRRSPHA